MQRNGQKATLKVIWEGLICLPKDVGLPSGVVSSLSPARAKEEGGQLSPSLHLQRKRQGQKGDSVCVESCGSVRLEPGLEL